MNAAYAACGSDMAIFDNLSICSSQQLTTYFIYIFLLSSVRIKLPMYFLPVVVMLISVSANFSVAVPIFCSFAVNQDLEAFGHYPSKGPYSMSLFHKHLSDCRSPAPPTSSAYDAFTTVTFGCCSLSTDFISGKKGTIPPAYAGTANVYY